MVQRDYPEGELKGRLLDIRRAVDAALAAHEANLRQPFFEAVRNLDDEVMIFLAKSEYLRRA